MFLQYGAITGFCQATKEYCPPGPPGVPGNQPSYALQAIRYVKFIANFPRLCIFQYPCTTQAFLEQKEIEVIE